MRTTARQREVFVNKRYRALLETEVEQPPQRVEGFTHEIVNLRFVQCEYPPTPLRSYMTAFTCFPSSQE